MSVEQEGPFSRVGQEVTCCCWVYQAFSDVAMIQGHSTGTWMVSSMAGQ
jgi:hypothetical protein